MLSEEDLNFNFYSYRKYKMFHRCNREYYFHYFLARGGHEIDTAPDLIAKIHLLKNIKHSNEMLNYIFNHAIKKVFLERFNLNDLIKIALKESYFLENMMLIENYKTDHKYPILFDFYYRVKNIKIIFDEFNQKVKDIAINLVNNEQFQQIFNNDKLNFFHLEEKVAQIYFSDIQVFSSIIAVTREANKLNILGIKDFDISPRESDFLLLFQLYYAMYKYKTSPENVNCYLLDLSTGSCNYYPHDKLDITLAISDILNNYQTLIDYSQVQNPINYHDINVKSSSCEQCRFQEICTNIL